MTRNEVFVSLDNIEKDFDKSMLGIESNLPELPKKSNTELFRSHIATASSSFSTLLQYTLSLAELNSKLEAELIDLRQSLVEEKATNSASSGVEDELIRQLHAAQLQAVRSKSTTSSPEKLVSEISSDTVSEMKNNLTEKSLHENMTKQLLQENDNLRNTLSLLNTDLYAARLATKYLDKELAGRIQQIQLIGKSKMEPRDFEKLWTQLESEIFLHRQKTLIKACRAKSRSVNSKIPKQIREVMLKKMEGETLGISITGGVELGVPIIISDIQEDGLAAANGEIVVGDSIRSINGMRLKGLKQSEAAAVLSNASGEIILEVQFLVQDLDEKLSETSSQVSKSTRASISGDTPSNE